MKKRWALMANLILVLSLLMVAAPAHAKSVIYTASFYCLSNNKPGDCAIGEDQLKVDLIDPEDGQTVQFKFYNLGPYDSAIRAIYFDDRSEGVLKYGTLKIVEEFPPPPAVDFVEYKGEDPPNPPAGNEAYPPFVTTDAFQAQAVPPPAKTGIDPYEHLIVGVDLPDDVTIDMVFAALEAGYLRIAIHVIDFASGGSETFITDWPSTVVELISFGATSAVAGTTVNWVTGSEIDNAGFNLYRSLSPDGPFVKVNGALIPAKGDPVAGASYSYADTGLVVGKYHYILEDVDLYGVATQHGLASASALPSLLRPISRPVVSW